MSFETEPTGYIKTALSELQGSWGNLRRVVVKNFGFNNSDKLLFHIDEGMSWESVRDLKKMKSTLLLVQNIAAQSDAPEDVIEWVDDVRESLEGVFEEIAEGKVKQMYSAKFTHNKVLQVMLRFAAPQLKRQSAKAKDMIRNEIINFQDIPNVGKAIEKDFILIGLKEPIELVNKDPYLMYNDLCKVTQQRHDPCVIDVFISAVNYMNGSPPKKWWEFTKERKTKMGSK